MTSFVKVLCMTVAAIVGLVGWPSAAAEITVVPYQYRSDDLSLTVVSGNNGDGVLVESPLGFKAGSMISLELPLSSPTPVPIRMEIYRWDSAGGPQDLLAQSSTEAAPQIASIASFTANIAESVQPGMLLGIYVMNLSPNIADTSRQYMLSLHFSDDDSMPNGQSIYYNSYTGVPPFGFGLNYMAARVSITGEIAPIPELPPYVLFIAGCGALLLRRHSNVRTVVSN